MPVSARRVIAWCIFSVSALAATALFFVPAFIIRPFAHQAPSALNLAMAVRQRAPWGTLIAAVICIAFAKLLWKTSGRWRKITVASVLVVVAFSTVMARLNYFEWMFHPFKSPQFDAEATSKLDQGEMVLAIRYGDDARAYPISQMAYHHILNDVVGGVPVAVTY
jgi:hypothetical protein